MRCSLQFLVLMLSVASFAGSVYARGVYQQPEAFLQETFSGAVPEPAVVWVTQSVRADIETILGHKPDALRIRYWAAGSRTAWILEEIGKDKPITTGVVVNGGSIERIKVLVFRESRGWEVRHDFFTDQFKDVSLQAGNQLDKTIDGISGATLSVRALRKIARLALYLDRQVIQAQ